MRAGPKLVIDSRSDLGEGPCWDNRRNLLYWVNITEGEIHIHNPADSDNRVLHVGQSVSAVVPSSSGHLVAVTSKGFIAVDPTDGGITPIYDPEPDMPDNRFNDGKCDPQGRFWAGTISLERKEGVASLYRLNQDLTVTKALSGVTNSNGIAWNSNTGQMYYIDTPTMKIDCFDYDAESGNITNRGTAVEIPSGMGKPDGMTIDEEGMLWVCLWGGGAVTRWNPERSELLERIEMPAVNVTSCAFGGADLNELYVTTARRRTSKADLRRFPMAGGVFKVVPGVGGQATPEFSGSV